MNKPTYNQIYSLSKSYNQLAQQLKKSIESGKFYQWTMQKRQYVVARLLHLLRLLRSKGVKMAASASIVLLSTLSINAQPGTFFLCEDDPFESIDLPPLDPEFGFYMPLVADLDNDGDDDLVVITWNDGDYSLQYFENDDFSQDLIPIEGMDNPLEIFNDVFGGGGLPPYLIPSFGDADLDGRLDLVFGEIKGEIFCFLNKEGGFVEAFDGKDFDGIEEMDMSLLNSIQFANIDGDCEDEMIITSLEGGPDGAIIVVNDIIGNPIGGEYVQSESMAAMFDNVAMDETSGIIPYFFDLNSDGIDEMLTISGKEMGPDLEYNLYEKVGGLYTQVADEDNPFISFSGAPFLPFFSSGDIDGNGFLNLYIGLKGEDLGDESIPPVFCADSFIRDFDPCAEQIPTMGQWGIYILGLCILIFGVLGMSEQKTRDLLSPSKQK